MSYPTYDYTFEQYSKDVGGTAQYPLVGNNLVYPALKLAGEAGELADKIGKHWRNKTKKESVLDIPERDLALDNMSSASLTDEQRIEIIKELGDVLWYIMAISSELGVSMESVASTNRDKLLDRQARGTICSRGDNR